MRLPDPCVVSRGFAPDSGDALLTVRSHFSSPAVLTRDGRGGCPPMRGASPPLAPAVPACGLIPFACSLAPEQQHENVEHLVAASVVQVADLRFAGPGDAQP